MLRFLPVIILSFILLSSWGSSKKATKNSSVESTKNSNTENILGISYSDFKIYIEQQFTDDMTWDNYGEWQLDHKTPISWAKNETEVYELNNYNNFQPLWTIDNQTKGNRYESI